ncbi:MAG: winged helix-turn-helix domain-containing protein [Acidobacteria bacterium]|nr:winged helix-turn-helix domain-containing protein [Acidobacteriota bacterium]
MNTNVLVAFDSLLETMHGEKARLADAVKEATLNGQFAEAKRLLAKTERVEQLAQQVRQLRESWERLDEVRATSAVEAKSENDEEDIGAGDEEDAPELAVVDKLFRRRRRRKRGGREAVNKTPNHAYRVPILEALEQLGGKGRVQEVLNTVYVKMKDRLTEDDLKPLPSGRSVRWENTARWERQHMVDEGLLRDDSPIGVWEMSEAGRAYLEQAHQQAEWEDES